MTNRESPSGPAVPLPEVLYFGSGDSDANATQYLVPTPGVISGSDNDPFQLSYFMPRKRRFKRLQVGLSFTTPGVGIVEFNLVELTYDEWATQSGFTVVAGPFEMDSSSNDSLSADLEFEVAQQSMVALQMVTPTVYTEPVDELWSAVIE